MMRMLGTQADRRSSEIQNDCGGHQRSLLVSLEMGAASNP